MRHPLTVDHAPPPAPCRVFITALPAFVVLAEDHGPTPLGVVDYLGLGVWVTGFAVEVVADWQKTAWRKRPENQAKSTWINEGLWSCCRHPNYFGCAQQLLRVVDSVVADTK